MNPRFKGPRNFCPVESIQAIDEALSTAWEHFSDEEHDEINTAMNWLREEIGCPLETDATPQGVTK